MTDLFEGYAEAMALSPAWDEVFTADGGVREACATLHGALTRTPVRNLRGRGEALAGAPRVDQGAAAAGGEELPSTLDAVPRVVPAHEWEVVEAGVVQRVRALEAFLADVHGPGRALEDGVVPRRVVTSSPRFCRVAAGIEPPNGVRVHVCGVDLVRDADGAFTVLGVDVRAPSGVGRVLTDRAVMAGAMPEAFTDQRIRPVSAYPRRLLAALRAAAPVGIEDPTVVVLTPGVFHRDWSEHALLARRMGVELVEGRDLLCRGGRLHMRTTGGLRPVHVVHRRVDDEHLDPVHFDAGSPLGCPGLLTAARAGNAVVANAVGNGVADDVLVRTYLPDLVRYYLSEEPVLRDVRTWRLEEPAAREEVLDRLGELVLKPVEGSGGRDVVVGPAASAGQLEAARAQVLADPRGWVAQPLVALSTVPSLVGDRLAPRRVDLRAFAVHDGSRVWVLPGGLTRVVLPAGGATGASSRGGPSKDTWVLAAGHPQDLSVAAPPGVDPPLPPCLPPDAGPGLHDPSDQQHRQQARQQAGQQGAAAC